MQNGYSVIQVSPAHKHLQQGHLKRLVVLLVWVVIVAWIFLAIQVTEALWQTLFLFLFVAIAGLGMINRLSRQLKDAHLQKLGYVYLLKLLALLFVLYAGWVPMLDFASASFGYDPQRYYFDAATLAQSNFDLTVIPSINYNGIVVYYGLIFAVFGHNPTIPALVNAFITLWATLVLVRVGYLIKRERRPNDWFLGLAMVIPEVLWFDVMTSRETLSMSLITISTLSVIGYLMRRTGDGFSLWQATMALPALLLLAVVRTSMLIPALAVLAFFFVSFRLTARRRLLGLALIGLEVFILLLAPALSERLGSSDFDYGSRIASIGIRDETFLSGMTWTEHSVGQLLIPENPVYAMAFAPIRLLFYLVAPLPAVSIDLTELVGGNWGDWQRLMTGLSALLYLVLFPRAVAALIHALRDAQARSDLVFHIPFWVTMVAIAGGNQIIHERYRIMAMLLLWGCIWLGQTCPRRLVQLAYVGWGGVLMFWGVFYVAYKNLL